MAEIMVNIIKKQKSNLTSLHIFKNIYIKYYFKIRNSQNYAYVVSICSPELKWDLI